MKRCPACAEKIQSSAIVCRFCGYRFSEDEMASQRTSGYIWMLVWIVGICVMIAMCTAGDDGREQAYTKVPPIACDMASHRQAIDAAQSAGLILAFTERGAAVDERLWRQLSMGQKVTLAKALACRAGNGTTTADVYVSIRGSDGTTIIASGLPYSGSFGDKD